IRLTGHAKNTRLSLIGFILFVLWFIIGAISPYSMAVLECFWLSNPQNKCRLVAVCVNACYQYLGNPLHLYKQTGHSYFGAINYCGKPSKHVRHSTYHLVHAQAPPKVYQ